MNANYAIAIESKCEENPFSSIHKYNDWLVENKTLLPIRQYISNVQSMFYPNVDISFMEKFMSLVERNDFCIPQEMLQEYRVLNNIERSNTIKLCLEGNLLVEDEDYRLHNVMQPVPQGGYSSKNIYTLTPDAFKMCLMRAKNSKIYARYYILLERCVYYHNLLQLRLSNEENVSLREKCDDYKKSLEKYEVKLRDNEVALRENETTMNTLSNQIQTALSQIAVIAREKHGVEIQLDQSEAHVQQIIPDRVIRPVEEDKCGSFVLMKIDEDKFWAIRCQKRALHTSIKKLMTKYPEAEVWMQVDYHPNPVKLWNVIKKRVSFASVKRNTLTLNGSEVALRAAIEELERERLQ